MSDLELVRCRHCGLLHHARALICPGSGLRLQSGGVDPEARHRARALPASARIGSVLGGKYRLISVIGQGGMSAVYEALHLGLGRPLALKVLQRSSSPDEDPTMERLEHEARVVSRIQHVNICGIYDLGYTDDGCAYLVMERLLGETLRERLEAAGSMTFGEIAPLMRQVLAALQAAHEHGIIHRDLKPDNIFLEQWREGGRTTCKLLDFGISTYFGSLDVGQWQPPSRPGWVMGTPYYMAPEQARGDSALDPRADLWAVAVILYEALTGRRPFVATNYQALLVKILTSEPRSISKLQPALPPAVDRLLVRGMAKLREDRFQSATEFEHQLTEAEQICAAEDPQAPTLVMRRRGRRPSPRHAATEQGVVWHHRIDDPSTVVDDEATDVDPPIAGAVPATARQASAPLTGRAVQEAVFGVLPPPRPRAPGSSSSDSVTRPRGHAADPPSACGLGASLPGAVRRERDEARSEDTATTLVVQRELER